MISWIRILLNKFCLGILVCVAFSFNPEISFGDNNAPVQEPIAYWALDEGFGKTIKDKIHSHPGTLRGGVTWSSDCVKGKCLHFDGKDDEVSIPHTKRFNLWDKKGSEFTVVALPDTQGYSQWSPLIYFKQTQWIIDNIKRLNIKFVIHLGDIVDFNTRLEWKVAKKAMKTLDGRIPYLVVPGNHDVYIPGKYDKRTYKNYNKYFSYKRFKKYPWYGGHYPKNGNQNNYGFFSSDDQRYIVLGINWTPDKSELDWAGKVLSEHKDKIAIVITHEYMDFQNKARTGVGNYIFNNLIKHHSNIVLVASGHILGTGAERRVDYIGGQPVNQVLQNYQMILNAGQGFLRYYTFRVDDNKIDVKTYSPHLKIFHKSPENQFTLDYRKTEMTLSVWVKTQKHRDQMLISKQSGADGSFYLVIDKGGLVTFNITNSNAKQINVIAPFPDGKKQWHHLAGVYDGEKISLYINGKLSQVMPPDNAQDLPTFFIPEGLIKNTSIPIKLGGYDGPGLKFKGSMDEVKIFNRALSPDQIFSEYARFGKKIKGPGFVKKLRENVILSSSSILRPPHGPEKLLTKKSTIWHAQSPPQYPEWVEIKYSKPIKINKIKIKAQGSRKHPHYNRAPKDFIFQGSNNRKRWKNLLKVRSAVFSVKNQWLEWTFSNGKLFKYYRFLINANGGDPSFLTIQQLALE